MAIGPGSRLGPYEVTARIGAGGMGEVYRATDTKLKRAVAIKVLPASLAADADRLARFQREAEVLASLNHPNIAAIHGLEESNGVRALVMELVEGETIADRIARGPIPLDEALPIAKQIAEALEAAHEQGIIHRDLKPANVKVRPDGTVKVLDFGLAKAMAPAFGSSPSVSQSPTITTPAMTEAGMILGTAAYMSPEQARGQMVDKRSDIWAFGCVLYEMLTGHRPFKCETLTDTIAAIIEREPDWSALPATSAALQQLLRRTLQKSPRERLRDIADARFVLADLATGASTASGSALNDRGHAPTRPSRVRWPAHLAWAVAAIAAMALTAVLVRRPSAVIESQVTRFDIPTPPATSDDASLVSFAVSPDSRQIVFVAVSDGVPKLWLRQLDQSSARPLPATDNALYPFWAPDGQAIGFFADGTLKRIDLGDGVVRALARAPNARGGTWSADGVILYSSALNTPLFRIDASGGRETAVTRLEQTGHSSHRHPQFLPDGQRFIFTAIFGSRAGTYLASLNGSEPRRLIDAGDRTNTTNAAYVTPNLLSVEQSVLVARRLDLESLKLSEPQTLANEIAADRNARSAFSISPGMLATRTAGSERWQSTWFDRSGRRLRAVGPVEPTPPVNIELSPDGRYAAIARGLPRDVWVLDTARDVATRLTTDPGDDFSPVWSPDGQRVAFRSNRDGPYNLFEVGATGGEVRRIVQSAQQKTPLDWSPDGRFVLYAELSLAGGSDLFAVTVTGDATPTTIAQTQFDERDGQFAPDNRWIAYASDESGRYEVYLQPFPARGAKTQISIGGGIAPRWRGDGKELFYVASDGTVMSVPLRVDAAGHTIEPGTPVRLFRPPIVYGGLIPSDGSTHQQYAVMRDGQRFLVNTNVGEPSAPPIRILLNWQAALKRR